jgi:hypothetical protein
MQSLLCACFLGVFDWINTGLNRRNLALSGAYGPSIHEQAIDKAGPTGPDIQDRGIGDSGRTLDAIYWGNDVT